MAYTSPFNLYDLFGINPSGCDLAYRGTLDTVLSELEQLPTDSDLTSWVRPWVFHPPRIVRAILDYAIDEGLQTEKTRRFGIECALAMYQFPKQSGALAKQIRSFVCEHEDDRLLYAPVYQETDSQTLIASAPDLSHKTARTLVYDVKSPVLFIALGHGGVPAGMDVYLRFCDFTSDSDSVFYPVRFSRMKKFDEEPCLFESERSYLREVGSKKEVILFDEDAFTMKTIAQARRFFYSNVFDEKPNLHVAVNLCGR